MIRRIIFIVIALAVMIITFQTFTEGESDGHEQAVIKSRQEKEDFLKNNSDSPFVKAGKTMLPLSYYPINSDFKVQARVERMESRQFVSVSSSDGTNQRYLRYAWLHFKLQDQEMKLIVLKPMFSPGLFLGFSDNTSSESTYGGGRYLDLMEIKGDRITLDFNLAYNPYCAYDENFACPLPPRDNILPLAIEAGQLNYSH